MADPNRFIYKNKPIIYIKAIIELYNRKNYRQFEEIYKIIEFEKIYIWIIKNLYNLSAH